MNELAPPTRSKSNWIEIQGHVFDIQWFDASRDLPAHRRVTYSYRIDEEWYSGSYMDFASQNADFPLKKGGPITLFYNPRKPGKSRVTPVSPGGLKVVLWIVFGILIFLLEGFSRFWHLFHHM